MSCQNDVNVGMCGVAVLGRDPRAQPAAGITLELLHDRASEVTQVDPRASSGDRTIR